MDPDIPAPSIEGHEALPNNNTTLASTSIQVKPFDPLHLDTATSVPLPPSSPMRSPYRSSSANKIKSSSPHSPSRSPSSASSYRGERQSTPTLSTRRSVSNLSTARGATPQFRRASSNLNPASPATNGKMPLQSVPAERPPVTAASVTREYFGKELEAHSTLQSPLVVIVHDSCYGHRFSRPRATKNALATIVERPERIHATLLGASTAYVRLGGRHAEGPTAPGPKHDPTQVRNVPFRIRKTSRNIPLNHPSVAFVHGSKWMEELQIMCDTAEGKLSLNGKELVRPIGYGKDEAGNPLPKLHEGDLYLCSESLAAFQGCLGGVCDAVDTVFSSDLTKRAFVCIRPPGHHCSSNFPSGFCWLNNVHVGISYAAMNHGLTHAAIIDFDLHHGDGSQNIAWDHNRKAQGAAKNAAAHKKTPIGYYSLHDINSYPCEWGDEDKVRNASLCIENAHGQSIWNVHLEPWKTYEEFWQLYETRYTVLLEKARKFLRHHTTRLRDSGNQAPKAAIFISAGFDASEWEGAGMQRHSVNVPTEFYARFTADIVKLAHEDDLGVDGRVISVLEGGYSDRALTSGVLSHICGFAGDAATVKTESPRTPETMKFQTINEWMPKDVPISINGQNSSYAPEWWALQNLEELEAVVAGHQPQPAKSFKDKSGNYSSPTQASTLKMTHQARERQSLSAMQARLSLESEYVPPPPDVDWATASYELSRVIVPHDRQTLSCTHEELNAEATRARKERQSNTGVAVTSDEKMQLRDRKAKAQPAVLGAARASSRNGHRRTTIAAIGDLPDPTLQQQDFVNSRPRRRSSDASSILSSFQNMRLSGDDAIPPLATNHAASAASTAFSSAPDKAAKAVVVRKPRAPAAAKTAGKPKTSPRKPRAAPQALAGAREATRSSMSPITDNEVVNSSGDNVEAPLPSQIASNNVPKTDEMDNLTNGVKKISIKLKVPTPEEHAAREQQKNLDDKQKKPRAPRKPPVPKTSRVIKPAQSAVVEDSAPIKSQPLKNEDHKSSEPQYTIPNGTMPTMQDIMIPMETPTSSTAIRNGPEAVQIPNDQAGKEQLLQASPIRFDPLQQQDIYMREQSIPVATEQGFPESAVYPSLPAYQQTMTAEQAAPPSYFMPQMNTETTPSSSSPADFGTPVRRTKEDLPVFTSQSPIPFAPPSNPNVDYVTPQNRNEG
ncbi:histone deacetylase [Elasticomyces elasticus]|uniref:Histone deacetylase n=1 Tax=Exophiala sideris TaxID=1016849 RepID=A0ABR0IWC9_9EURO|nr:histone deacetylase [Elasticomyces elasticus]KAK5021825.1 histone deacetylase [Exophiala sideris]KAK5025816.1 histone deacetylase [Exophiala sideris]KAK5050180.1 histone deacetylase [Exophiala sideris]KAK5177062.1 histone deacetylase [Eurotiomycetes sp. CCFEE 6388]